MEGFFYACHTVRADLRRKRLEGATMPNRNAVKHAAGTGVKKLLAS